MAATILATPVAAETGNLWVNGHRTQLRTVAEDFWDGGYHGVTFEIMSGKNELSVSYTAPHGVNGMCVVVAE
ncbi:hypothetical protein [Paracoccus benzoatiresistens]|uniref:Uncharacterized protein n=1 Tax=Paracoccus benzoatiresistens TaxID=2997341 RepID=A0ABT4J943_9RHOB|nr:hypothetical protein [Paracoccus sp. EF6]MCZ0963117.1 hypothetical protein [Paracoccus sp. EF6]